MTIPVICDRCRVAGTAGTGDFSHFGDLLDFRAVKVRPRVNGWDPDAQRAFIALLAATGSKRRAALAIGRNAFGIDQLLKRPDADSFRAAYDRAMAIAQQNGAMKLAAGIADAAARNAVLTPPSRLRDLPSPLPSGRGRLAEGERGEGGEGGPDPDHEALALSLFRKYLLKVQSERTARLAGRVVEADLYLRQLTFFEVMMDLAQEAEGVDTWTWLAGLRRDGHGVIDIARTPFSRFLDEARRMVWEGKLDEPPRPDPTPEHYLLDRNGYSLEPGQAVWGGADYRAEMAKLEEQHRRAAEEQVEWESRVTAEHKAQSRSDTCLVSKSRCRPDGGSARPNPTDVT